MERCPATVTGPGLQGWPAIQLEDSAPAGSTSSAVSAQSVLQDTTASPTADVSDVPHGCSAICSVANVSSNASSVPSTACECGRRLCDEVTGKCICPPQTVKPSCEVCQAQTFSYHPLLGCDGCECSPTGIKDVTRPDCDHLTGQCKWVETCNRHICNGVGVCSWTIWLCVFVVASLESVVDSVIAVLRDTIASLSVYLATATVMVSLRMCATQTLGGVSARWLFFMAPVDLKPPPWIFLSTQCRVALSCIVVVFAEKCGRHQVRHLQGRILLLWPFQPSWLH